MKQQKNDFLLDLKKIVIANPAVMEYSDLLDHAFTQMINLIKLNPKSLATDDILAYQIGITDQNIIN